MTKSLTTVAISGENLSSTPELIEKILALQENEKEYVLAEERKTLDGLMLKELPKGLKYAFLGCNDTKPVIISSKMDNDSQTVGCA